jgi:cyclase
MKIEVNILIICIFSIMSVAFSQQREAAPVEFKKISERLYEISGGQGAKGGAYIGDEGVLIVDAKMDKQSVDQVIAEIRKITDKPVQYLVNTHSDDDHVRGNRFFPQSVTFIAHENCRKELFLPQRDGSQSEWNKLELSPFVPSLTFRSKMDIYLRPQKVELWYFGIGHTTGDAVVYFPEEKAAFLGDQIFLDRPQLIHSYKGGNSFEHVNTLERILETLDAKKFFSGHSVVTDREGIRNHIDWIKERQEKVKSSVEKGKSLEEIKIDFKDDETRLIESIYNEIKSLGDIRKK